MTDVMMIQSAERTTSGGAIAEVSKVVAVVDEMTETGTDEEEELIATATGHCAPPFLNSLSAEASMCRIQPCDVYLRCVIFWQVRDDVP